MVSVIIPVYNGGSNLTLAVDSAIAQDMEKEIIIIDDCSTDNGIDLLKEHLKKVFEEGIIEKEAVYIYHSKKNIGVAAARNKGVAFARGEYIAFLDADDWWDEHKLSMQLAAMRRQDAVLCCTARELFNESGESTGAVIDVPEKITLRDLEKTNYINCSSVVMKKSVAEEFPMEKSNAHEDYLTWLRLLKKYDYAIGINVPLLKYRLSASSKSGNKLKSALMTYKTYRYAGYGLIRSAMMMVSYTINGLKKYRGIILKNKI